MKRLLTALLLAPICFLAAAQAPQPPEIAARAYLLLDVTANQVLAAREVDAPVEPASLTKLMSAYLVFDALKARKIDLKQTLPVSERAWKMPGSRMFIDPKMQVPVEDLVKGMIVQSGNDATIALAEKLGGTESGFVQIMNTYAQRLGLKGTRFTNSWGGPAPDHYSTARDIAMLSRALIRQFPDYYKYYAMREFTWNKHTQQNRNGLLARDPSVDGIKTGHTESAKYCLVSSARRNGMRLISVVLGSPSIRAREDASATLLNYGFTFYETVKLQEAGKPIITPRVFKGSAGSVAVGSPGAISITLGRGQGASLTKEAKIDAPLVAPLALHARVGEYIVRSGDEVVARVPLVTLAKVDEGGLWRTAVDTVKLWFE